MHAWICVEGLCLGISPSRVQLFWSQTMSCPDDNGDLTEFLYWDTSLAFALQGSCSQTQTKQLCGEGPGE